MNEAILQIMLGSVPWTNQTWAMRVTVLA